MSYGAGKRSSSGSKSEASSNRKVVGKVDIANGGLKVLPPEDDGGLFEREDTWNSSDSRPSSSRKNSAGHRPPRSDTNTPRRTPTPSKQVHLQAARKKDSNDGISFGDFDWEEHNKLEEQRLSAKSKNKQNDKTRQKDRKSSIKNADQSSQSTYRDENRHKKHSCDKFDEDAKENSDTSAEQMLKMCYKKENVSDLMDQMGFSESSAGGASGGAGVSDSEKKRKTTQKESSQNQGNIDIENSDEFDTDLEDAEEKSESESEEEKTKAPNELLMEFIGTVMSQDWPNAQKLCKMILLYEPDNAEANKFQGLIEEKVQLEEELANESGSDYDSDEDDEDEDEDDEDDDSSEEDSDEESDSEDEEEKTSTAPDSGIGSETNMRY